MSSAKWWPFCRGLNVLTSGGRVSHICVSKLTIIDSDTGLSSGRRQAIIFSYAEIIFNLTIRNILEWNFNRNSYIFIQGNAFANAVCEMAAILSRPQCVNQHNTSQERGSRMCHILYCCGYMIIVGGYVHIDGLMQERRSSSALAMELRLSCTNQAI